MTAEIVQRIAQAGLIASLRPDQAVDRLLEIGDALLASPVLVVAVSMDHPEATALLAAYAERFGNHLLVGAGVIATVEQGISALAAGAQFLITTKYSTELHQHAARCGALYIPPAATSLALPALTLMDVQMVTLAAQMLLAEPHLSSQTQPHLIAQATTPETFAACAAAGAIAVDIGNLLFSTTTWSMPAMIRTARQLRQLWERSASDSLVRVMRAARRKGIC